MSYDLMLIAFEEGEQVDAVLSRMEEADERALPSVVLRSAFAAIASDFAHEGYELVAGDSFLNLINDSFGTVIDLWENGAEVNVAYWHSGDQATAVMESVIGVLGRVQQVTGWTLFDPQRGEIVADLNTLAPAAGKEMDRITTWADKHIRGEKRPWWKFWA